MDLNKIYPLLPEECKQEINSVVVKYLGSIANEIGFQVIEKSPTKTLNLIPTQSQQEKTKRIYDKFPISLHGSEIPDKDRLVELYRNTPEEDKTWNGVLNWMKVKDMRNEGMSFEEIFPVPPTYETRQTIIKKIDNQGNTFTPL
jgi:hypothetical protein